MASTYEPIATTTLGSAASTITFSSIPSTYTDLRLVFTGFGTSNSDIWTTFNNDTSALYSWTSLLGDGTAAYSGSSTNRNYFYLNANNMSTSIPTFSVLDIFSYAGSTYKTALTQISQNDGYTNYVQSQVSLYRSTSVINRIDLTASTGNIAAGATATLYGIQAA